MRYSFVDTATLLSLPFLHLSISLPFCTVRHWVCDTVFVVVIGMFTLFDFFVSILLYKHTALRLDWSLFPTYKFDPFPFFVVPELLFSL